MIKGGTYAEYNIVNENIVAKKPKNLTFAEAASLPLAAITAWDCIVDKCKLQVGETILIIGAGGGVGVAGVQLAVSAGARVIATTGDKSIDLVKKLGAHHVFSYKSDWVAEVKKIVGDHGVDVIVDFAGGESISKALNVAALRGRASSIVNLEGSLQAAFGKNISFFFEFILREGRKINALAEIVALGKVKPVIDSVYKLADIRKATEHLEKGGVVGKIVLEITSDINKTTLH